MSTRRTHHQDNRRLRIRAVPTMQPDIRKLAQAVIGLALAQAEADAQAQHQAEATPTTSATTTPPKKGAA